MHLVKRVQNSEFKYNVEILNCSLLSDNAKIQIYKECFAIFGSIECCAEYITAHKKNYPHFAGWDYNLDMSVEQLRTTKLKLVIESTCHELSINYVEA